jgi:ATP-dependent DNA ligase
VTGALLELPGDTVIDGEVVALDKDGKPAFNLLQGFGGQAAEVVLYSFDLLMLRGKNVRFWPLEERRGRLREIAQQLPSTIRYSARFAAPLPDLIRAVRQYELEGIVAKRAGSPYRSGERCGDWLKWRANRGQEFVVGGYLPDHNIVDSILVGYYQGRDFIYAGAGCEPGSRQHPAGSCCRISRSSRSRDAPLKILPECSEGHWGEGLTAAKMDMCRWLDPFLVAQIEFLEWTPEHRLRHARFVGIRSDKDAREVTRDGAS